tara:strand:+ start:284 stop:1270 length:987 start_codon:yes stop_codon:yes gene_type:complete
MDTTTSSSPNDFKKYIKLHFNKLTQMDGIRLHQLLQTSQYAILNALFGGIAGTIVEHLMPEYDPDATMSQMIWEVVGQSVLIGVFIFYVRKLVKVFPYLFNNDPDYIPYQKDYAVPEYQGDVVLFIAFIATQSNYLKRIKHLKLWFGQKVLGQTSSELEAIKPDANSVSQQQAEPVNVGNNPGLGAQTQTTGGGMMRVTAPPAVGLGHGNGMGNGMGNGNDVSSMIGPSAPSGMSGNNVNPSMNTTMNGGMNTSNYFTTAPTNNNMTSSFQGQVNMDSSFGQESPEGNLTSSGFAPMTSGSMDYSYIDMGGDLTGGSGFNMQMGNSFN